MSGARGQHERPRPRERMRSTRELGRRDIECPAGGARGLSRANSSDVTGFTPVTGPGALKGVMIMQIANAGEPIQLSNVQVTGVAAESALPGQKVKVWTRLLLTSDDP